MGDEIDVMSELDDSTESQSTSLNYSNSVKLEKKDQKPPSLDSVENIEIYAEDDKPMDLGPPKHFFVCDNDALVVESVVELLAKTAASLAHVGLRWKRVHPETSVKLVKMPTWFKKAVYTEHLSQYTQLTSSVTGPEGTSAVITCPSHAHAQDVIAAVRRNEILTPYRIVIGGAIGCWDLAFRMTIKKMYGDDPRDKTTAIATLFANVQDLFNNFQYMPSYRKMQSVEWEPFVLLEILFNSEEGLNMAMDTVRHKMVEKLGVNWRVQRSAPPEMMAPHDTELTHYLLIDNLDKEKHTASMLRACFERFGKILQLWMPGTQVSDPDVAPDLEAPPVNKMQTEYSIQTTLNRAVIKFLDYDSVDKVFFYGIHRLVNGALVTVRRGLTMSVYRKVTGESFRRQSATYASEMNRAILEVNRCQNIITKGPKSDEAGKKRALAKIEEIKASLPVPRTKDHQDRLRTTLNAERYRTGALGLADIPTVKLQIARQMDLERSKGQHFTKRGNKNKVTTVVTTPTTPSGPVYMNRRIRRNAEKQVANVDTSPAAQQNVQMVRSAAATEIRQFLSDRRPLLPPPPMLPLPTGIIPPTISAPQWPAMPGIADTSILPPAGLQPAFIPRGYVGNTSHNDTMARKLGFNNSCVVGGTGTQKQQDHHQQQKTPRLQQNEQPQTGQQQPQKQKKPSVTAPPPQLEIKQEPMEYTAPPPKVSAGHNTQYTRQAQANDQSYDIDVSLRGLGSSRPQNFLADCMDNTVVESTIRTTQPSPQSKPCQNTGGSFQNTTLPVHSTHGTSIIGDPTLNTPLNNHSTSGSSKGYKRRRPSRFSSGPPPTNTGNVGSSINQDFNPPPKKIHHQFSLPSASAPSAPQPPAFSSVSQQFQLGLQPSGVASVQGSFPHHKGTWVPIENMQQYGIASNILPPQSVKPTYSGPSSNCALLATPSPGTATVPTVNSQQLGFVPKPPPGWNMLSPQSYITASACPTSSGALTTGAANPGNSFGASAVVARKPAEVPLPDLSAPPPATMADDRLNDLQRVNYVLEDLLRRRPGTTRDNLPSEFVAALLLSAKVSEPIITSMMNENLIDVSVLRTLNADDLRELGAGIGDRKRIEIVKSVLGAP